ncbi:MAG: glycosyltransferase [Proteobacteria bacterium]|nr:glycosyltransferase [Pseudomonadota bacterium]
MHVVHVVFSLDVGGQERVILDLARGLVERGHRATVISLSEGGTLRPRFEGIPVETIASGTGLSPSTIPRLARRLRELRPDVVHTHNRSPMIYGGPAAKLARVPRLVHTKHGRSDGGRAVMVLSRLYDHYVCVSEDTAVVARTTEHVSAKIVSVIANGIDVRAFIPDAAARGRLRAELKIPPTACLVGTAGRLVPEKNYGLLLEAARGVLGPDVRLVIVGDGPERAALQAAVDPAIVDRVHWLGIRHDIPALLSAFDLFALSSTTEGLPIAVIEAMAAGLPILCTAVGGLPGVIRHGETGLLVPPSDVDAYRAALRELAGDPDRRQALGDAARADVAVRFSLDRVMDDYLRLYA